ncbi:MAG: type IV pilus assembly protein PilM [Parcubacteria group bacterium]|nr:type IV pilus assembly protein PilM [Parcubacteria group bacterium]
MSFFSFKETAIGLDISDYSIKAVYLKNTRQGKIIKNLFELAIPPGLINQGEIQNQDKLFEIFKEFLKKIKASRIKTPYIVSSLPEEKSFISVIQLPKMEEKEIGSALGFEIEANVPYAFQEVYFDWKSLPSASLDHLDILVAASPKKIVDSYFSLLKRLKLISVAFEIESQAIARALIKNEIQEKPILLIDLGATRTSFIIFSGGSIRFTSSIPVSSKDLTSAIADVLKIPENEAEILKIKHGLDKKGTEGIKIFDAILPRLTALIEKIQNLIIFYQSHAKHEHGRILEFENILLSGGGANLAGLSQYLKEELKRKIGLGNPFVNLAKSPTKFLSDLAPDKAVAFTTAIGLALRNIETEI